MNRHDRDAHNALAATVGRNAAAAIARAKAREAARSRHGRCEKKCGSVLALLVFAGTVAAVIVNFPTSV